MMRVAPASTSETRRDRNPGADAIDESVDQKGASMTMGEIELAGGRADQKISFCRYIVRTRWKAGLK